MTTRNQLERLKTIHEKLSTGLHYSLSDLMDACQARSDDHVRPSEKTLYNDLKTLRGEPYNAPIPLRDRSGKPYFYERSFSLFEVLNPTDATLANEAVALIRQMSTLPQFAGFDEILLRFEQQPGVIGRAKESVVQFEQNLGYTGLKWLKPLYDAIRAGYPVLIEYRDFANNAFRFEVSPYLLKEYRDRWFIFGWVVERATIYNLALDRIEAVIPLPNKRVRPDQTDWETEFTDVVGTTRTAEPVETLVLRVWLPRARYIETKPMHQPQMIVNQTDTYLDFQYTLRWNPELSAKILELGPDAELLEPAHRRAELAEKARCVAARYEV